MDPKVKIDRTIDPLKSGAEYTQERQEKVIEVFTPIMEAITAEGCPPELKSKAYKRTTSIFVGLCNRYQKVTPEVFDESQESADSRYAGHVVDIFKTLETRWPDAVPQVMTLCSSAVRGIVDVKQRLHPVDVGKLQEIATAIATRNDGVFLYESQTPEEKGSLNSIYAVKWSRQMPLMIESALGGVAVLKQAFGEWSGDRYFDLFDSAVNKNLFGAVVMELFADNHIYITPPVTIPNGSQQDSEKLDMLRVDFSRFRIRFLEQMEEQYKIPNYNFHALARGASANIAGLENHFKMLLENLVAVLETNSKYSEADLARYQEAIYVYALFGVYSSLEFGRYRGKQADFFETRKGTNRPNIPLMGHPGLVEYLKKSRFFRIEFTKSQRYGLRMHEFLAELTKQRKTDEK